MKRGVAYNQPKARQLSKTEVLAQLRALGISPGGVLLVHTSFREVRPIEGGPIALIESLREALGPEGTLVMPSWTGNNNEPFDARNTHAATDLGIVADVFWRQAGVLRSDHAFAAAAIGPRAQQIVGGPLPLPPHSPSSPVGRVHELDGQVLLLGVGHEANTTLHLAELLADVPYRQASHITVLENGRPVRIDYLENDHCCALFALAEEWLRVRGLQRAGRVGHARARLVRSQDIIEVAVAHLEREPLVFLHPESEGCEECDEARRSIPAPIPK